MHLRVRDVEDHDVVHDLAAGEIEANRIELAGSSTVAGVPLTTSEQRFL
jgi:hypothetical protein